MEWQTFLVLIVVIPIIIFTVALVWYMNFGGIIVAIEGVQKRRMLNEKITSKSGKDIEQLVEEVV